MCQRKKATTLQDIEKKRHHGGKNPQRPGAKERVGVGREKSTKPWKTKQAHSRQTLKEGFKLKKTQPLSEKGNGSERTASKK